MTPLNGEAGVQGLGSSAIRALRFNHEQLTARGIRHEVIVVEWALQPGHASAAELVAAAIPTLVGDQLVSIVIDGKYDEALRLNAQRGGLDFVARNVGVRRARGAFLISTDWGVCFGRGVLRRLADGTIQRAVIYRAPRVDVSIAPSDDGVRWEDLEDPRNVAGRPQVPQPPLYCEGAGDLILLDRSTFHRLRGFNEVYRIAAGGQTENFLVKAFGAGCPLHSLGAPVYHLEATIESATKERSPALVAGELPRHSREVTYNNSESWGLGVAPERALGHGRIQLDFDWSAVPPLVDLNRVVLPAAAIRSNRR